MSQPVLINCVLDKSGSMHNLQRATIEGFNSFLWEQQRQPGECRMSLTQFDTTFQVDYVGRDINVIPPLDTMSYRPGGGTALLDAVGTTIKGAEQWLMNNRPATRSTRTMGAGEPKTYYQNFGWKVLVVVFTDGEENSSREWHLNQPLRSGDDRDLGGLIQWKQGEGWEFMFLGTGGSDWLEKAFGAFIPQDRIFAYAATNDAHLHTYNTLSSSTSAYRGADAGASFSFVDPNTSTGTVEHEVKKTP